MKNEHTYSVITNKDRTDMIYLLYIIVTQQNTARSTWLPNVTLSRLAFNICSAYRSHIHKADKTYIWRFRSLPSIIPISRYSNKTWTTGNIVLFLSDTETTLHEISAMIRSRTNDFLDHQAPITMFQISGRSTYFEMHNATQ